VYDATNTNFDWDWNGIFMTLFEASSGNLATLNCAATTYTCEHASKLGVYYEWRSDPSMSWLEEPNDASDKKFMAAPLQLQGQMPTGTGAIPRERARPRFNRIWRTNVIQSVDGDQAWEHDDGE